MRKFLAKNVGWCAFYRYITLPLDYERTVTQQSAGSYLYIAVPAGASYAVAGIPKNG